MLAFCCLFAGDEVTPFVGRWYSEPQYDGQMYMHDIFIQLELLDDGKVKRRIFAIRKDDGKKPYAAIVWEASGTYSISDGTLKCVFPSLENEVSLFKIVNNRLKRIDIEKNPSLGFLKESNAPWAKLPGVDKPLTEEP